MTRRWFEYLMDDHAMTERVIDGLEKVLGGETPPARELVADAAEYFSSYADECHNRKEEEHLFPRMESHGVPRYGGPLAVMLAEHDRAKDLLADLRAAAARYAADGEGLSEFKAVFRDYAALLKDHYWKENDILYPLATRVLGPGEEDAIIAGIGATEERLGEGGKARYVALAERIATAGDVKDLAHGLDRDVLAALLNTLPVEISFVDATDEVRYFSHEKHDKIFPRSRSSIGVKVQNCHPPKSVHLVNRILADFKAGQRDDAEFWIDFRGRKVHIRYFAVRDEGGTYLGCMETVQDITRIQGLTGEHRLLDDRQAGEPAATY
ncbi:MAG: DUF438 domain-containing protein [Candidatus Sericytochromatia bacterium]|nr:DUF438 domain-containing protein [Candidatus Tanganyikabacteria bacterium]